MICLQIRLSKKNAFNIQHVYVNVIYLPARKSFFKDINIKVAIPSAFKFNTHFQHKYLIL